MKALPGSLRRKQRSKRWSKYPEDVLPLWIADMDFEVAEEIQQGLQRYIEEKCFGYRHTPLEAPGIVVKHLEEAFNWSVKEEDIVFLPSARGALNIGPEILGNKNKKVLVPTPIYPPFLFAPSSAGRDICKVPNIENRLDVSRMDDELSSSCDCVLFCSPHNPVGRVYSKEELAEFAEVICENNAHVVSDEVHALVVLDENKKHTPLATVSDEIAERTITVMGPGKPFNIAGLECAFAVITNAKLRSKFEAELERRVIEVTPMSFFGFMAAYQYGNSWLKDCLEYLRGNAEFLYEEVNKLSGFSMNRVEATYLAWVACEPCSEEHFLEKKLGIIPASAFGSNGHIRLNFATTRENLEIAVDRLSS